MPDIIHLLPDAVANQIAAGEVIQRPASIIKELVENAIDAHATRIQVVVEDAGKSLVQVIDNGCGMSGTDARLSFERHATSKIAKAHDLFGLRTMGFRGEALASIAAVAQVELRTRQEKDELGTCILMEGSRLISQESIACPVGANFAVRNVFFNIPARRKFLKSNQTELSNIMTELERIALANPDRAFSLHQGTTLMVDLPKGNFRQRIVQLFGRKIDALLVPVEVNTTLARISGFVGTPKAARRKSPHQFMFVNGRFMKHPYFTKAVLTAFERLIPDGQQVPYFLQFEVDPARIDVNIHPTKTEIKFEDDSAIWQILLAAVRESLGKYGATPAIDFDTEGCPDIPAFTPRTEGFAPQPPQLHLNPQYNPFHTTHSAEATSDAPHTGHAQVEGSFQSAALHWDEHDAPHTPTLSTAANHTPPTEHTPQAPAHWEDAYRMAQQAPSQPADTHDIPQPQLYDNLPQGANKEGWQSAPSEFLQYHGRYIVTPLNSGLALIDQHRAHVRILYEQYMKQLTSHKAPSQHLLFPEMLTLSPSESVVFESLLPELQAVGFDISPLGGGSFSILGTPLATEGLAPQAILQGILSDAMQGQANAAEATHHLVANALAHKVAMPVGQYLSTAEMAALIEQLFTCSTPNLTPGGAPTLIILKQEQIEKEF